MTAAARTSTRLSGRALLASRLLWLALAVFYGGLTLAAMRASFSAEVAARAMTDNFQAWTPEQINAAFAALRLSPQDFILFNSVSDALLAPAYYALGLFLFWRRSDDWLALVFSITFMGFLSTSALETAMGSKPLTLWLGNLSAAAFSIVSLSALMVFPDGRLTPRWMRWVLAWNVAVQVGRVIFPAVYDAWAFALLLPTFPAIAGSQIYRYFRTADPLQRQQIKWAVLGIAVTTLPLTVFILAFTAVPTASQPGASGLAFLLLGIAIWWAFLIVWPAGLIVSILRYRLWDIDVIIRRTLVYSVLTAALALAYFGSVLVLEGFFRAAIGQVNNALVVVLSTLAIAALFGPLRRRVQSAIDRRFYRQKYNATRILAEFGANARDETDLARLSTELVGVVDDAMQPAHVGLWLRANLPAATPRAAPFGRTPP